MTKSFMLVCSAFLFIADANGQTAADLGTKYHHHEVYEVEPGVQMTPKFASDGQVCEMQVEQSHFGKNRVDFSDGLNQAKINAITDQLVPAEERGEKINELVLCTGSCETISEYSNVFVNVLSHVKTRVIAIKWRNRTCG